VPPAEPHSFLGLFKSATGLARFKTLRELECRSERAPTFGMRSEAFAMSVLGIGVDMVEVERIQHSLDRFGERFMKRVFTEGEIAYCVSMKYPARHFAARFAAKEAVSKAFGTGVGKAMGWRDIDVHKKKSGEPFLVLHGGAEALAQERAMKSAWISLSHTDHHAVAMIALES
jgi:holo-[acyl-carrier protein] synthase